MLKRWAEVNNGKPGPHSRGGQARCQYRHLVCPWGTHRETGKWAHVKAMEGGEGGFEAQLLFLCDGDCDSHWGAGMSHCG